MILDVDPKVDYAFKHLFGRESTRPIYRRPAGGASTATAGLACPGGIEDVIAN
jgi:hypothetical protein